MNGEIDQEARKWGMWCHLSAIVAWIPQILLVGVGIPLPIPLPKCRQNAPTITEADIPSPKASTADGLVVR